MNPVNLTKPQSKSTVEGAVVTVLETIASIKKRWSDCCGIAARHVGVACETDPFRTSAGMSREVSSNDNPRERCWTGKHVDKKTAG